MRRWSRVCTAVGAILLFFGVFAGLVNHNVLDGRNFARNVDQVRQDPAVAHEVGELIAQQTLKANPNLTVLRPAIESLSISVAGSGTLSPVVQHSAAVLHQSITGKRSGDISLRLLDIGTVLSGVLPSVSPQAAEHIPPDLSVTLAQVSDHSMTGQAIELIRLTGLLSWLLPLLAILFFAVGIAIAPDRQRSATRVGWGIALCGGFIGLVTFLGAIIVSVLDADSLSGALIAAAWHQIASQLWWTTALITFVGLLLVAFTSARLPEADLGALATSAWHAVVRRPQGRRAIALRGAVLVIVGAGVLFRPGRTFAVLTGIVGIVVLVTGLAELAFAAGFRPRSADAPDETPARRRMATRVAWPSAPSWSPHSFWLRRCRQAARRHRQPTRRQRATPATVMSNCATAATTRCPSPRRTMRCRPPMSPAGTSPSSRPGSSAT